MHAFLVIVQYIIVEFISNMGVVKGMRVLRLA